MKKKMTKKEKLAAYKAEKATAKLLREQHTELASYLAENAEVIVGVITKGYCHDCGLFPKRTSGEQALEQRVKMLYGECSLFNTAPGRFQFSVGSFFHWANNINPSLWRVVPKVIQALCHEGIIKLSLDKEIDDGSFPTAVFKIVKL